MATNIKGPAIFLAQFAGDAAPFNNLPNITRWAADLGYKGVQIPTFVGSLFDLEKAAESQGYCDEVKGIFRFRGCHSFKWFNVVKTITKIPVKPMPKTDFSKRFFFHNTNTLVYINRMADPIYSSIFG